MRELYSRIDKDNSGCLDLKEVILFMKALTDDLSEENITMIFDSLDMDSSNSIDFDEFMKLFEQISFAGWKPVDNTNRDAVDEAEVQNLFYLIDVEKKGVITVQDARLAKELIRERFCIDEVGGVLIVILSSPNLLKHFIIIYSFMIEFYLLINPTIRPIRYMNI